MNWIAIWDLQAGVSDLDGVARDRIADRVLADLFEMAVEISG